MPSPPRPSDSPGSVPTPPVEFIFQRALELHGTARETYLAEACTGHATLAERVRSLLAAHEEAGDFLREPAPPTPELEREMARLKPEEAGDLIGPYKLLQPLGEGGFGTVWMAEQSQPVRRRVALKLLKLGMDTKEVIARFEQERQALALMDHPNIAQVFDAGATPFGRPYFVMELVRGIRITDYCDQANLSTEDRLRLGMAVCNAVHHAHQKGVIHRDLKPSNILVTLHDGVPVPKVIDFGVAKATQARLTDKTLFTQFEQMIGTPLYMSPEQAEMSGLDVDTRSDVYALGVLLYELLTGQTPFTQEELLEMGLEEMRRVIREREPRKPSTAVQTLAAGTAATVATRRHTEPPRLIGLLRGDLDWIVMKCLEKDRTRRYDSASALMLDLERHLRNEPVLARPPSAFYRVQKFARRNKLAVSAVAAITLSLLGGIILALWQAGRAHDAEGVAREKTATTTQALTDASAQRDRVATLLSISQAERGQRMLEQGDARGLLHLVEARRTVEHLPEQRAARTRLWQGSYASLPTSGVKTFTPDGGTTAVAISVDGTRVYAGTPGKKLIGYDLVSGAEVVTLPLREEPVWSIRLSPNGKNIYVHSGATIEWWELPTGEAPRRRRAWRNGLDPVGLSANRRWLIDAPEIAAKDRARSAGAEIQLVDLESGSTRSLGMMSAELRQDRICLVSDDGRWLAATGARSMRLYALDKKPVPVARELHPRSGNVEYTETLFFTPDGQWLFQHSISEGLCRYQVETGEPAGSWPCKGNRVILGPGGKMILFQPDTEMRLLDPASGQITGKAILPGSSAFTGAAFAPDGDTIATAHADGRVRLWDAHTGDARGDFAREPGRIGAITYSDNGRWLAVSCDDGQVRLHPALAKANNSALPAYSWAHSRILSATCPGRLLVASEDRLDWRDLATGQATRVTQLKDEQILGGTTNNDGSMVVAMSGDEKDNGTLRWWKEGTARPPTIIPKVPFFESLAFSPDDSKLAGVEPDSGTVHIWARKDGTPPLHLKLPQPMETVWVGIRWSPDGHWLATRNGFGGWMLWDVAAGKVVPQSEKEMLSGLSPDFRFGLGIPGVVDLTNPRQPKSIAPLKAELGIGAFDASGRLVSMGGRDNNIRIWETVTGKLHGPVLHGPMPIHSAFTPDAQTLVTLGEGLRFWDMTTGLPIGGERRPQEMVFEFLMTPDGRFVTVNDAEGAEVWALPHAEATLPEMERLTWLHTGSRIGATGDFESLTAAELKAIAGGK